MNKKIKNLFLAGALVLGLAGVAVSCTDYDDDINKLQSDISSTNALVSQLQTAVDGLKARIDAGAVITSVTKVTTGNGGWLFTLSDGNKYEVSNGASGSEGPAGAPGKDGKNGKDGKDGKDGKWYVPNDSTGLWDIYEMVDGVETVVGSTDYSYLPSVDPNEPTIAYDSEKKAIVITDGDNKYEISLVSGGETSLVFIPQVYVDGVEGFESISYSYYPLYVKEKTLDTKNEFWAPDAKKDTVPVQLSPAVDVQFHVNVSDAVLDDTFEYEFIWKDKKFLSTRGQASEDFAVIPTFKSFADGVLTLGVEVFGKEATEEYITTMALQATKGAQTVTSDYFTVFSGVIENLRIADPQALSKKIKGVADEHYRRGTVGISKVDAEDAFLPDKEVWTEGEVEQDQAHSYCDTAVAYTGKLDLKTITLLHYTMGSGEEEEEEIDVPAAPTKAETDDAETELCYEMTPEEMEGYGLTFKYEIVKNYKIGKPVTDQAEFVTLDDGVFTPKVFTLDGTPAAIGRTPIVRVTVLDGTNVVEVAYIKVYIKQTEDGPAPTFTLTPRRDAKDDGENIFRFKCNGDKLITTVKDMNEIVYTGMNMSAKVFHAAYDTLIIAPQKDTIGTVRDSIVDKSQGTHVIVWELTAEELWENSGKDIEILARYQKKTDETLYVDIKLTASVEEVGKSVTLVYSDDPEKGNYDVNYWYKEVRGTDPIAARFNVNVPAVGEKNADKCQFENDINAPFITYTTGANAGKLLVENVDSVAYFFCKKDVEAIKKIGDLNVKFRVGEKLDSLFASIVDDKGKEILADTLVAWIENAPVTKGVMTIWNTFHYVKDGAVADTLLNTNKMYTYLTGNAYLCLSNPDVQIDSLPLNFKVGETELDHFEVDILQPVFVGTKAKDKFIDGVNFGAKGSYIKIEDLLDPYDWRADPTKYDQYYFSYKDAKATPKIDNAYFWDYYGPFEVLIDIETAECDLNGVRGPIKSNIILTQTAPGVTSVPKPTDPSTTVTLPANEQGYLTYLNNTTNVQAFNIFVKAKVKYGFGYINSAWITIPVDKTEGQPSE